MRIDWANCSFVEAVPRKLEGRPVVRDSRVLADTILECTEIGETPEEIADDYRLPLEGVRDILTYAARQAEPASAR